MTEPTADNASRMNAGKSPAQQQKEIDMTIRQGDVFLIPATIPAEAAAVARDRGRVVLAYGEVTGHAHAIAEPSATLLEDADARFLRIVGSGATLTHEEHAAIELAPGEYRVIIGREFTPDLAAERVVD